MFQRWHFYFQFMTSCCVTFAYMLQIACRCCCFWWTCWESMVYLGQTCERFSVKTVANCSSSDSFSRQLFLWWTACLFSHICDSHGTICRALLSFLYLWLNLEVWSQKDRSGGGCGEEMMFTSPDAMYIDPENCAGENSNGFVYNFVLVCYVLCSLVTLVNTAKTGNIPSIPSGCSISLRIVNVHTSPHCFPSSAVRFQDPMNGGTLVLDFCIFWLSFRVIFPEISACGPNVW